MKKQKTNAIPVLIDNDAGADDYFALLRSMIQHKKGNIDIVALTTAGGNVKAQCTFDNNIRASMMMDINVPIGKGTDPVGAQDASHIHGKDGIGNLSGMLPKIKKVKEFKSIDLLKSTIEKYEGELVILALGPLTNLAQCEKKYPGILKKTKRIIAMGGAFFVPGNVTPVGEFNVWFDPASSQKVYHSGANITLLPLDVTTQLCFGLSDLDPVLSHINHKKNRDFLVKLAQFTIGTNMMFRETHYRKGFFIHDATTLAALVYPHLFKGTYYNVNVETKGEFTTGQTIVDVRNHPKQEQPNAYVITEADALGFLEAMTEDFKDFDFGE